MEKAKDIRERSFQYALQAIKLFQVLKLQRNEASAILSKQYLRAATSVGANLEEAYAAESKRDFLHKCRISLKEVRECRYWLRLMNESDISSNLQLTELLTETCELVAIMTTIVKKTAKGLDREIKI